MYTAWQAAEEQLLLQRDSLIKTIAQNKLIVYIHFIGRFHWPYG
ncbi:MAG: hypothetical protein JWP38_1693 [Herbaspirillum sp.]|jgi:hypothetical protein|nr:hypothetical protein [Herbaspirillum sp.]